MLIEKRGTFFGVVGSKVHFSQTGTAEYWGDYNTVEANDTITGLGVYGDSIIAFTDDAVYAINGDHVDNISITKLPYKVGCSNKRTVASMNGALIWYGKINGKGTICMYNGGPIQELSLKSSEFSESTISTSTYETYASGETYADYQIIPVCAIADSKAYYAIFTNRMIIFDLSVGNVITYVSDNFSGSFMMNDNVMVVKGTDACKLKPGYSTYKNFVHKTGEFFADSLSNMKSFRKIIITGKGEIETTVIIDSKSVFTTKEKNFFLPANTKGYKAQLLFKSTGYAKLESYKVDYQSIAL